MMKLPPKCCVSGFRTRNPDLGAIALTLAFALAVALPAPVSLAQTGVAEVPVQSYIDRLLETPYLELTEEVDSADVGDYLVALGAMQKIRGVWAPRSSERITGSRQAYTWRLLDGFTSAEVIADLDAALAMDPRVNTLFSCEARACGSSVQWANRIFRERLLYGTEVSQRYRALSLRVSDASRLDGDYSGASENVADEGVREGMEEAAKVSDLLEYRLLIYGSARTNDRQYLRVELILLDEAASGE